MLFDPAQVAAGGGALGVLGYWLWLYLRGKQPSPGEKTLLKAEVVKRDKMLSDKDDIIATKDEYIKELVKDLQERNESLNEALPVFSHLVEELMKGQHG